MLMDRWPAWPKTWRDMVEGKESFSIDNDIKNDDRESNLEAEEEVRGIWMWIRIRRRRGRLRRGRIRGRTRRG